MYAAAAADPRIGGDAAYTPPPPPLRGVGEAVL
jgi:hypothetical protein